MNQTITIPKTVFENLVERLSRLEQVVFGRKSIEIGEEIRLTPAAKKRYKKIEKDIKEGKNIYSFDGEESALKFLLSDKR